MFKKKIKQWPKIQHVSATKFRKDPFLESIEDINKSFEKLLTIFNDKAITSAYHKVINHLVEMEKMELELRMQQHKEMKPFYVGDLGVAWPGKVTQGIDSDNPPTTGGSGVPQKDKAKACRNA